MSSLGRKNYTAKYLVYAVQGLKLKINFKMERHLRSWLCGMWK